MKYRNKRRVFCWIFIWSHLQLVSSEDVPPTESNFTQTTNDDPNSKDMRGLFSPRMDYDQWKPLGRGDPLKNDPTYDYVPPVLDRVHYWIDPALRKPDPPLPGENQKTEILLLGVSSKKPSTGTSVADSRKDTYDSFLKFVDGPKFTGQRNSRPNYPMTSSYFPPNFYSKNKGTFPKANEQRMPYTMLMPPPMVTRQPSPPSPQPIQKPDTLQTTTVDSVTAVTTNSPVTRPVSAPATHQSQVTIQAANLVYQSSSLSNANEWKTTETSTNLTPNPAAYSTKKLKPFKEEVVFQKHLQPPEPYMQVQFSPSRQNISNKPLVGASSDHNVNYVTPPPLIEQEIMHKGQVSDDNLDISNTYVKIGKTEAQMHSTAIDNIPVLAPEMLIAQPPNLMVFPHVKRPLITQTPLTMQTLQSMQSMQPPPITTSPIYKKPTNPIRQALDKEKSQTEQPTTERAETTSTTPASDVALTTTIPTTTMTTSLTTDPLFKHYKQPMEPLRGPLYLIIQGHSKVKTYGPSKQFHGIRVQETNEISDDKEEVHLKHLHNYLKNESGEQNSREGRSGNLQTLKHVIQTGLGAIDFSDVPAERRQDESVKETELQFGYKVGEDATSETYHKGIVEEARKLHVEA
ncbi:mucin-2 [Tenebrio molitor]|uniref:mucin-2 n=1 Tax=Tenebrio molitor TaxID=7067 RepID=UPI0036248666